MKKIWMRLLVMVGLLTACAQPVKEHEPVTYQKISGEEAAAMMHGDVIILDVRTLEEYDAGHIQDAVLLPYDAIDDKAAEMLPDKDKVVLVYCRTGRRSEIAARALIGLGYTAVYDFGGITTDWSGELVM